MITFASADPIVLKKHSNCSNLVFFEKKKACNLVAYIDLWSAESRGFESQPPPFTFSRHFYFYNIFLNKINYIRALNHFLGFRKLI